MGNHPSIKFQLQFEKPYSDIIADVKRVITSENKIFSLKSEDERSMIVQWLSPGMKWLDEIEIKNSGDFSETSKCSIVVKSRSTNFCPTSFACCMPCCAWYGLFSDHGMNEDHILKLFSLNKEKERKLIFKFETFI